MAICHADKDCLMADIHTLPRKGRTEPLPFQWTTIYYRDSKIPTPIRCVAYRLRRARGGVAITVIGDTGIGHTLKDRLPNFEAARAFMKVWARRYGQTMVEHRAERPRHKLGSREDRAFMRAGGCKESWLSSDAPVLWGHAVSRCQSPRAECGAKGRCEYGDCNMIMDVPDPPDNSE